MGLIASVTVAATLPDGTPVAYIQRQDLIFNAAFDDMNAEAELTVEAIDRLAEDAVAALRERLIDWGRTAARMNAEEAARPGCPYCGHPAAQHSNAREDDFRCLAPGCSCMSWLPSERDG